MKLSILLVACILVYFQYGESRRGRRKYHDRPEWSDRMKQRRGQRGSPRWVAGSDEVGSQFEDRSRQTHRRRGPQWMADSEEAPWWKGGRRGHANRRPMHAQPVSRRGPSVWEKLFSPGRFRFGMGPRHGSHWFDIDLDWGLGSSPPDPWWKGPNVCFTRNEENEEGEEISSHFSMHSQVCDGNDHVFKCTTTETGPEGKRTVTELYECCHGFTRFPGEHGCTEEIQFGSIIETANELELSDFIQACESTGLTDSLSDQDTNITIFAPINEAFAGLDTMLPTAAPDVNLQDMGSLVIVSEPMTEQLVGDLRNVLLGHMGAGLLTTSQLENNQLVETASPFKSKIRINMYTYPEELTTANCKRVRSADNLALNGVIHVVEEIIPPVTDTLLDIVSKDPNLSYLKTALGRTGLSQDLREEGDFTLFAPTDDAFGKIDPRLLQEILNDPKCLTNVLKNHMISTVICSSIIQGRTRTTNALHKSVNLTRDEDNKLFVNDAQIVQGDIMGINGVIHIIDDVLLLNEALNLLTVAKKEGQNDFLRLVDVAGLTKELQTQENVTILVPSNDAIRALPADVASELTSNPETLRNYLKYHVIPRRETCSTIYNDYQVNTLLDEKKIRFNEYMSFPFGRHWVQTAQCARFEKMNVKGCNGIMHIIDRVLVPPPGNVVDVLAQHDNFTTLVELLKEAGIADTLQESGPFTVFAPTDQAFANLGTDAITELRNDMELLREVILNHVTKDTVCCAGVFENNWFRSMKVRTMSGDMYPIERDGIGRPAIEDAIITQCDVMGSNGVVHAIDTVLVNTHRNSFDLPSHIRRWFDIFDH